MGQLIDDLLRFSRLGRAEMKSSPVDMTRLAQSVLGELLSGCAERKFETALGPLPKTRGDLNLLRQVLINLIGNAVKYTAPKDVARIEIGGRAGDSEVFYFVRDNGVGFSMDHANKLFGVFQRLHTNKQFDGTGVGLALVQRIIERHGGRVWAEGRVDEGATFWFTLPPAEESRDLTGG